MRVVREVDGGIVRRVMLLDDAGDEVAPVNRFLSHLTDSAYSPNTVCAYAYDLGQLARFLEQRTIGWNEFRPSTALELLGYLRRVPSPRPAQRLGLTVATEHGQLLSPASVQRILSATSSFLDGAIAAEQYIAGENRCNARYITRWVGCRIVTGRSSGRRAGSSRCAARCGKASTAVAAADVESGHRCDPGQPHDDARLDDLLADARRRAACRTRLIGAPRIGSYRVDSFTKLAARPAC